VCHSGAQPGTPKLSEYADFLLPSKSVAGKTMAEAAVVRMQSTTSPMPPLPAVHADPDEIQTMSDWVKGGTKRGGVCTNPAPVTDAGTALHPTEAGVDAGPQCTSGTKWTMGNTGSPLMHPGEACSTCHQVSGGPNLRFGGTVYRGAHDIDDCNGAGPPPTITVTVTDRNGRTLTADVNDAGNFEVVAIQGGPGGQGNGTGNRLMPPYLAKLTAGNKTRAMIGTVNTGDCNVCHTAAGANNAPGRILSP
jgi:hypothetical protein